MQNRYTGDIGDFGKLGLLRRISRAGLSVGVNWYLTPDETHNGDGRHTAYLKDCTFRPCDPPLWQALGEIVAANRRQVSALEAAGLLPAVYYGEPLDFSGLNAAGRQAFRNQWHSRALERLRGQDILFADPDTGLIVPSAAGKPESRKYVLPQELADCYRAGSSVIYYQHKARRDDGFYSAQHRTLLLSGLFPGAEGMVLKFKTTSQRYYCFFIQPRHADGLRACVKELLSSAWGYHFTLL